MPATSNFDLRREAANKGETKYKMHVPCRRGHLGMRYTSTGGCVECTNVRLIRAPTMMQNSFRFDSYVAPALTSAERIDLEIYLWECLIAWSAHIGKPAPINSETIRLAKLRRVSPHAIRS
jgi:hypothetical protein